MAHFPEDLPFPVVPVPPSAMSSPAAAVKFLVGQLVLLTQIHSEHQERVVGEILSAKRLAQQALGVRLPSLTPKAKLLTMSWV